MNPKIAVIIPSIPPRAQSLARAFKSVTEQTLKPIAVSVAVDVDRLGAPVTRQRALDGVTADADWVAPLDDDDEFKPFHLRALYEHAVETDADYVYSWFELIGPGGRSYGDFDPVFPPTHFSSPFDYANPIETTITILIKRELLHDIGYVQLHRPEAYANGASTGEDRNLTLECINAGAKIEHLVRRTWNWHHHGRNTSGRPDRW